MRHFQLLTVVMFLVTKVVIAQELKCGTPSPSYNEVEAITSKIHKFKLLHKSGMDSTIAYVPIYPWLIYKADGTGSLTMMDICKGMVAANQFYYKAGIQFYICGGTYMYEDSFYNLRSEDDHLLYAVNGAINMYFPYSATLGGSAVGGYSYYGPASNKIVIIYSHADNERTFVHELGHFFGLMHTFDTGYGREFVSGKNCLTAGDLICDTPADPGGQPGYSVNGCEYTGTTLDPEGNAYHPFLEDAMAYNFCGSELTPEQLQRIKDTYHTFLSGLNCNAFLQTEAPTNLIGQKINNKIVLNWVDNSTMEIGYIIERSTNDTSHFYSIGVVEPDVTSFTDNFAPADTACFYRIKPTNAFHSFSNIIRVNTGLSYCKPIYADKDCFPAIYMDGFVLKNNNQTIISNDNNGCSGINYSDYSMSTVILYPSSTYNFTTRMGKNPDGTFQLQYLAIFIDYNMNGSFEDPGEMVYKSTSADCKYLMSGSFTIPNDAIMGETRLRIRSQDYWSDGQVKDPCVRANGGEVEDYTIAIGSSTTDMPYSREQDAGIRISPNPFKEEFQIWIPPSTGLINLAIFSSNGKLVFENTMTAKETTIHMNGLKSGLYFLKISNSKFCNTRKIIKQNPEN